VRKQINKSKIHFIGINAINHRSICVRPLLAMMESLKRWQQNCQFLSDLFDLEEEEMPGDGGNGDRSIVCTLPMAFFGGLVTQDRQVQFILHSGDGTVRFTAPEYDERIPALTDEDGLYGVVERYYRLMGKVADCHRPVRVRDFTFPVIDPRHWGRPRLAVSTTPSTSSSFSSMLDNDVGRVEEMIATMGPTERTPS
jgi:hypothetical protein